jgi:hypothetical protein
MACGLVGSLELGAQAADPISPPIVRALIARILAIHPETFALTLDQAEPDTLFTAGPERATAPRCLRSAIVEFYDARVVGIASGGRVGPAHGHPARSLGGGPAAATRRHGERSRLLWAIDHRDLHQQRCLKTLCRPSDAHSGAIRSARRQSPFNPF